MYDPANKVTKVYSGEKSYVASKYYLNLFTYYFYFLFWLHSLWDLSSLPES